jgi:hypothetical protein
MLTGDSHYVPVAETSVERIRSHFNRWLARIGADIDPEL